MATFNESHAPTSRNQVSELSIIMPNLLQAHQSFWLHSSVFALENQPKNAKFLYFLPLKKRLVGSFSKACALTFRKYISKTDVIILNLSDKLNIFGCTLPFLSQKSSLKIWIFRVSLPPKEALVATFNGKRAPTFGKYAAEI